MSIRQNNELTTAGKEFLNDLVRLRYRLLDIKFTSKKDAELELKKLESNYASNKEKYLIEENSKAKQGIPRLQTTKTSTDIMNEFEFLHQLTFRLIDTNCKQCNNITTTNSKVTVEWRLAICSECRINEDKRQWEELGNKERKEEELNPLIRYCHIIINVPSHYEIPYELKQKRFEERLIANQEPNDQRYEELRYLARDYKSKFPYNPKCGMTEDAWWKQIRRKRDELREREKQVKLDWELSNKSPTWLILNRLEKVRLEGCNCTTELMRRNQFCPACRLMVKVYEYALELFKNSAEGRMSCSF